MSIELKPTPFKSISAGSKITVTKFKDQDYDQIKKSLLARKALFEDPTFPAAPETINLIKPTQTDLVWKRPKEISSDAQFIQDGASRFDIVQGSLGDCWLLASICGLAQHPNLLANVVPQDQNFGNDYCGLFRFRFWQFGEWVEVLVDDRLPTRNNRLVFVHSASKSEFWCALFEKAYAKLYGCYECLKGGLTAEAMEDFSGGVVESYNLKSNVPADLFSTLTRALSFNSLAGCSIEAKPNEIEQKMENGLVKGHAYTVTGSRVLKRPGRDDVNLIRVRNPWGNDREWLGAWSDNSPEWTSVSQAVKQEIGLVLQGDGEFWMSFDDFLKNFTNLEICLLSPEVGHNDKDIKDWDVSFEHGGWKKGISAGGCFNFPDSFFLNPQYKVKLIKAGQQAGESALVISLLQKGLRKNKLTGAKARPVGFVIYKIEDNAKVSDRLDKTFFQSHTSVARSTTFVASRECCTRFHLAPGNYVIIPSTYNPNEEADYLLRLFSESPIKARPIDTVTSIPSQVEHPKPEENDKLKPFFDKIAGKDGEIDSNELQGLLNSFFSPEFSTSNNNFSFTLECARSLVAMMDKDNSGKLGLQEFGSIWSLLMLWKGTFKTFDKNHSNDIDSSELRDALQRLGYRLSTPALSAVASRFATKSGSLTLDDFFQALTKLRNISASYEKKPANDTRDLDAYIQAFLRI